jgi:Cu(I)/Ag(I) efflux system protein CusF
MKKLSTLAAALLAATALTGLPAFAQEHKHSEHHEHHGHGDANEYENTMVAGEIRKIDLENNKVTIKHEEIKKYSMAGMTMNFRLKATNQLDGFKPGDKVRFIPDKVDGGYVLRSIEKTE